MKSSGSAAPKISFADFCRRFVTSFFLFGIRNTALVLRWVALYEKLQSGRQELIMATSDSTALPDSAECWPAIRLAEWKETYATLHMWTQIVGKIRLELTPKVNHWWNVPFYVNAHGLTVRSGRGVQPTAARRGSGFSSPSSG